jgi:hypothetical protein
MVFIIPILILLIIMVIVVYLPYLIIIIFSCGIIFVIAALIIDVLQTFGIA